MEPLRWLKYGTQLIARQHWSVLVPTAAIASLLLQATGSLQGFDLRLLDRFFLMRGEAPRDSHVVLVTLDEDDLSYLNEWPISDQNLSQLIQKISAENPAVIGLDLFRNLKVEPGSQALENTWRSTPNLLGVYKAIGKGVPPNPTLEALGQTAMADVVLDPDAQVRRGLLSIQQENGTVVLGLASALALNYLEQQGVTPEAGDRPNQLQLGKATFNEITPNEGAYINADIGGYQILMNYQGLYQSFNRVSLREVMQDQTPRNFFEDKVVLIGTTAESVKDKFQTPFSSHRQSLQDYTPGVYVHANLASQIIASALEGRPLFQGVKTPWQWGWVFLWSGFGSTVSLLLISRRKLIAQSLAILVLGSGFCLGLLSGVSSYGLFLLGWWMPAMPARSRRVGACC
ncbi:MAG: CHASE2 domain-containing protein [Acaryochloridaceae cyanobacterium RL_2_7]|nr:CHASE2 domain-containing protein [Acaryochloridaceae cyanobacterium RL_2_7]